MLFGKPVRISMLSLLVGFTLGIAVLYGVWRETRFSWSEPVLGDIRKTGTLRVLTRNTSTTYYNEHDQPSGPEFELAQAFADFLEVKLKLVVKDSIAELFAALDAGEGHLIAAGITRTDGRESRYRFGPDYQTVQQQVVCRRDRPLPTGPAELVGRSLAVISDSSYLETLSRWQRQYPEITWQASSEHSTEQIMTSVAEGVVDCVLADSNIVAVNLRYLPELAMAFAANESQPLAWVLPTDGARLEVELHKWLDSDAAETTLPAILYRYYSHVELFDEQDLAVMRERIDSRLPELLPLFKKHAAKHKLPWTLIAALAYQESHWDPRAVSPTGVRGVMMLTRNTAKAMKVKDRTDPEQSIAGGTRYLARMLKRLPDSIRSDDRHWFALAAYTLGMGHVQDARTLAKSRGQDPDSWHSLAEVLPLLSQQRHYRKLPHGYARGSEAVRYVTRVLNYQDMLLYSLQ